MQTLQEQLNDVEALIAAENARGSEKDQDNLAKLEQKREVILMQMDDEKAKQEQERASQVRIQVQEEKVQSLTLPYDFNELYGDSTANDSIIEVVQIFLREAHAEHNEELHRLIEENRVELQGAVERELQLKRQNDELQQKFNADQQEILRITQELQQVKLERDDALAKRDAAVSEKEGIELLISEKQAQIEKLRDEMAIGAKAAINVTNINPSDRLAALVEQSKSAKIKSSIELALERTEPIRGKIDVVAPPKALEEATFPTQASNTVANGLVIETDGSLSATDSEVTFQLPRAEAVNVESGNAVDQGNAIEAGESPVTREEFEALERRIVELEKVCSVNEDSDTQAVA